MNSLYPTLFIEKTKPDYISVALLPTEYDLVKKETAEFGVGIYAVRAFERGDCIGHFLAEPMTVLRQHTLQRSPTEYLEDLYFVGYLLHSCDPNVVLDMHQQKVFCLKDIHRGDPLFMDYSSTEDTLFKQFPCACSAPNCRYWVTGRNEKINEDGRHYLELKQHELLYLNTMIAEEVTSTAI